MGSDGVGQSGKVVPAFKHRDNSPGCALNGNSPDNVGQFAEVVAVQCPLTDRIRAHAVKTRGHEHYLGPEPPRRRNKTTFKGFHNFRAARPGG